MTYTGAKITGTNKPLTEEYALICVDITHGAVDKLFHYRVPRELSIRLGMRVWVPFGKGSKSIIGYVMGFSGEAPVGHEKIKDIINPLDNFCVLTKETIALAFWMRDKYYTTLAYCVRCILPSCKTDGSFQKARKKKPSKVNLVTPVVPTKQQENAVCAIKEKLDKSDHTPILLHGVTGSGKTEVYLHAIAYALAKNKQAIVLVPEIALTPQIVDLFTARFGSDVAVTHSRLTGGERFDIWKKALEGTINIVIGPRSAVFAPFGRLGLIIIDEEHEHTYHSEITPKYDTRAVALKRGSLSGAVVVLGSATPSLESYFRAKNNLYSLTQLTHRINNTYPQVTILDMRREMAKGNTSLFASDFKEALEETLEKGQQAILFLNRRGHSSFVSCRFCGNVLSCQHCRVNYTYHVSSHRLLCHYCGRGIAMPSSCPACGSVHINKLGTGTQKIEEEVAKLFPKATALRMDMDTTKGKFGHVKILDAFRRGDAQILIGTQMVAKGLDFPLVTFAGVVLADQSLFSGDFRAGEYTFQLLTQVSGRAGRAGLGQGKVFLQTYNPEHYAINFAKEGRYEAFYEHEIILRKSMCYPPFSHVFSVMFTGPSEKDVITSLQKLFAIMQYCNKKGRFEFIGLSPAFVSKINEQYRWKLLVKCVEEEPLKAFVLYCMKKLRENDPLTGITANLSLDPVMME